MLGQQSIQGIPTSHSAVITGASKVFSEQSFLGAQHDKVPVCELQQHLQKTRTDTWDDDGRGHRAARQERGCSPSAQDAGTRLTDRQWSLLTLFSKDQGICTLSLCPARPGVQWWASSSVCKGQNSDGTHLVPCTRAQHPPWTGLQRPH